MYPLFHEDINLTANQIVRWFRTYLLRTSETVRKNFRNYRFHRDKRRSVSEKHAPIIDDDYS